MFPEEVKQLINRTKTSSSRLDQLRLFLDDKGMIRCEGRIEHSSVSSEAKKPVLLPRKASRSRFDHPRTSRFSKPHWY
jgi:hypothetical protein